MADADLLGRLPETGQAHPEELPAIAGAGAQTVPIPARVAWTLADLPSGIRKALFFCALIVLVIWGYSAELGKGQSTAESFSSDIWNQLLEKHGTYLGTNGTIEAIPGSLDATTKGYLLKYARTAVWMAETHLRIVEKLYKFYYALLLMSVVTTALATMLLFFIMKIGWNQTNEYVQIAFVVFSVSAVAFNLGQGVFRYGDNIEAHKKLYVECVQIEGEIVAYAETYRAGNSKIKGPDGFILEIADKIKNTWQFSMTFDPTKIESPGELANKIVEGVKKQ